MISEFKQPSNPANKIYLRQATVAEAMPFSDVSELHSEKMTTQFLNTIQLADRATDAKHWTEGDRLTALLWYWIHTAKEQSVSLSYSCQHCGQEHVNYFPFRTLFEGFGDLAGKPFREYDFKDRKVIFKPVTGEGLEACEEVRREIQDTDISTGKLIPLTEQGKDQLTLERLLWSFNFLNEKDLDSRREWVMNLTLNEYWELLDLMDEAAESMAHGIPHKWDEGDLCIYTPLHECIRKYELPEDKKEGAVSRQLWPFLGCDYISSVGSRGMVSGRD